MPRRRCTAEFDAVAAEWLAPMKEQWSEAHYLPRLGKLAISKIDVTVLLAALQNEQERKTTPSHPAALSRIRRGKCAVR